MLFIRLASTFFSKINFKIGSYGTIYTFKNYFTTIFSVFSFQLSIFKSKYILVLFEIERTQNKQKTKKRGNFLVGVYASPRA